MRPHDELYHYGVKGMKWGVRRTPEQLARLRGEKLESKAKKHDAKAKALKARSKRFTDPNVVARREYKAEEHRRKAVRLRKRAIDTRSTKMKVIDAVGSRKALSKTITKNISALSNPHDRAKAIEVTYATAFFVIALNKAVGTGVAFNNVRKMRNLEDPSPIKVKPSYADRRKIKNIDKSAKTFEEWLKDNDLPPVKPTAIKKYK